MADDIKHQIAADNQQGLLVRDFCDKIAYAFQLATGQGPLCQEPMQGVAVFLEELSVQTNAGDELDIGRLTGESIRLVREGISAGFLDWSPRIMLAMYSCEIQATSKFPPHSAYIRITAHTYLHSRSPGSRLRRDNPSPRPDSL